MTPGVQVYVRHPRRWGLGEMVRERKDGQILVRFAWDGREHPVPRDCVTELEAGEPHPLAAAIDVLEQPANYQPSDTHAVPKDPPWRSASYRAWIRTHACCRCGSGVNVECSHHPAKGHGSTGMKCTDARTLPLCNSCHARHHQRPLEREWIEDRIALHLTMWVREVGS